MIVHRTLVPTLIAVALISPAAALGCGAENIRWAGSSNSLYVSGPVACTLTEVDALSNKSAPSALELVDPDNRIWILRANLRLENGARLNLHGSTLGGDVDELRLASPGPRGNIFLRAHWGIIDIRSTRIRSWDEATNSVDVDTADGRAYIHARSILQAATPRESRLDIYDSEISHLGYNAAESYGLVWKVLNAPFDQVNVYGDIVRSYIHGNYMGMYSYGAYGMLIRDNEFANNISYGIDPHDDSDSLVIDRNYSHDNGNHGIICSRRCDDLVITNNLVVNNNHGIMLHRDVTDSLVENNQSIGNRDTGIVLFESHRNTVRNNEVRNNRHGIRLSLGSEDNVVDSNLVTDNTESGLYFYQGTDLPETTDGRPKRNTFRANLIANHRNAIKLKDADSNVFENNTLVGIGEMQFHNGVSNRLADNRLTELLRVRVTADAPRVGGLRIESGANAEIKLNPQGEVVLSRPDGQVYGSSSDPISVVVDATGVTLALNHASMGASASLQLRELWMRVAQGAVRVDQLMWGSASRRWRVQPLVDTGEIEFELGSLPTGREYSVWRNGVSIGRFPVEANGRLRFSDRIEGLAVALYEVN